MPIVSVINYKGGVGKTTLTANIAARLADTGRRVLMIDLDPQCSLTFSFVQPDYWSTHLEDKKTIKEWFDSFTDDDAAPVDLKDLIFSPKVANDQLKNKTGRLDLISSHLGLINVDLELATELSGANMSQTKKKYMKVHRRLADGLSQPAFDNYDLILIDCPPNFNVVTKTAIIASDHILVPAKPDYLSTLGTEYLIRSLDDLVKEHNEYLPESSDASDAIDPKILGVVFTMVQFYAGEPIAALRNYIEQTRSLDLYIFANYFRENKTHLGAAAADNIPIVLDRYENSSDLRYEIRKLVDEFVRQAGI